MTVNDDTENNQDEESSDDSYWQTYFEAETISMDAYRKRRGLVSKYGNKQEQQTTKRLEISEKESEGPPFEVIFDR